MSCMFLQHLSVLQHYNWEKFNQVIILNRFIFINKTIHQYEELFTLSHTTFDMWPNNMRSVTLHHHNIANTSQQHRNNIATTSPLHRNNIATTSQQHHHNITTTSPQQTHNIQTCHACSFNIYQSYNITIERNSTIYYFKSFHFY